MLKLILIAPYALLIFILLALIGIIVALDVYFRYLSYKDELSDEQRENGLVYLQHEYVEKYNAVEERIPKPKFVEQLFLSVALSLAFFVIFL